MAVLEVLVVFWKEWGIQALVLLSFTLQVILLITSEIRQRKDSGVLRVIVWSAYLLADTTAIYTLGHMSVTTTIGSRLPEHQLVAFWVPFLLLHLGGQDNITAYSIEDNRLWLRHLQNFVAQVLAAGYILYESSMFGRQTLLRQATVVMFVVGVIKYGERVWALKCASTSNLSGKNYRSFGRLHIEHPTVWPRLSSLGLLHIAHLFLNIPKHLLKGPLPLVKTEVGLHGCGWEEMYQVSEAQLSLMYEVRVMSPVGTVAAFLLFRRSSDQKEGYYNRVDVATTYVLLVGSVVLEITSVLRAMFSSWAEADLVTLVVPLLRCVPYIIARAIRRPVKGIRRIIVLPRYLVKYAMQKAGLQIRYWSGSMGQHNLIYLCTESKHNRWSKVARWMGREDLWNTLVYTSFIPVPADFSKLLKKQVLGSVGIRKENSDHIRNSRGRAVLKRMGISQEELPCWSVDIQLDESILVWHVATHVYLIRYDARYKPRPDLAAAIEVLSNYMVFLLAARTYMLPDNASRQSYVELCNKVINNLKYSSADDLIKLIQQQGEAFNTITGPPDGDKTGIGSPDTGSPDAADPERPGEKSTYERAAQLAAKLISEGLDTPAASDDMLDLIAQVWVEMLCYASYRCTADSHARQLSNGGEITTVVAILMEYMKLGFIKKE